MIINGENVGNNNDQNNDHKSNNDDASTTSASPCKWTGHSESDTPRSKMLKSERGVSQPTEEKMSLVGINIPSTRIAEVSSGEGEEIRRERERGCRLRIVCYYYYISFHSFLFMYFLPLYVIP